MKKENSLSGFDLALNYITYQSRTIYEVREYLIKKSFSESDTEEIIEKLIYYNYLDDKKFLSEMIENNRYGKQYGPLRLKEIMMQKGVDSEVVAIFDEIYNERIEKECFNAQWERAIKKYEHEMPLKRKQKIYAYLWRRGFSSSIINEKMVVLSDDVCESREDLEEESVFLERYYIKYYRMQFRKGYSGQELKQRVIRNLMTKGYTYDRIKLLIDEHSDDFEES